MKVKLVAGLAAGLTAFLWSTFSWMVLPWHNWDFFKINGETRGLAHSLRAAIVEHGIYTFPVMPDPKNEGAMNLWKEAMTQGPFAFLMIKPGTTEINMGLQLSILFLNQLLVGFILLWILDHLRSKSASTKVATAAMIFFIGASLSHLPYWNFWFFPLRMTIINILDLAITGALMAVAILQVEKRVRT